MFELLPKAQCVVQPNHTQCAVFHDHNNYAKRTIVNLHALALASHKARDSLRETLCVVNMLCTFLQTHPIHCILCICVNTITIKRVNNMYT